MGSLRSFVQLPPASRGVLAESAFLILAFRVALWVVPFSRTQRVAAKLGARPARRPSESARVAWAMDLATRRLPVGNCLSRALAAQVVLTRSGHDASIRIGVARERDGRFLAHAWVESDGEVLVGGDELERYRAASGPGRIV
jgi:hypothetical protein